MKYISHRAIICTLTLLIIIITVLFTFLRSSDVPEYITAPVRKGDIENSVLATGRIDAIERVNVGAQVSGQLKSLKVKQGDHVTKGQLIAEIDDLPQCNDLRNAEAALNEVKAELQSKQALLKQAELRFKRQLRMLRENASSHEDFESAEAMLATTRAELPVELAPESVMKDDSLASNTSASGSGTSNASVYYNALFDVPNPENRLRIAMTAQVTLITDEAQNTLLVPIQAVHRNEGKKQQVLVLAADGRLEPRNVKTGITNSVDIQILEGLNVGENVVLSLPDKKEPEERIML